MTTNKGEDRNAVFGETDNEFYYLSEQNGRSMNVYKSSIDNPTASVAVTSFKENPVRFLSRSKNNTLCFSYDGAIYTKQGNAAPQKITVTIALDGSSTKNGSVSMGATERKFLPTERKLLLWCAVKYSFRGWRCYQRITNTPYQERSVSFSPDGRSSACRRTRQQLNIYTVSIERKEEPYLCFYRFKTSNHRCHKGRRVSTCLFTRWKGNCLPGKPGRLKSD